LLYQGKQFGVIFVRLALNGGLLLGASIKE
jgi:hypothetical protein